ncbi:hypothetical protein RDWZM_009023 [Blomia tropicalis]|uniref:RecQ mediated genome instability protein 1 OB-fold domain-containing protein n=1 Tax=Blomia tropicalis TaxID=40697 RepID=A0A9Q0RKN4_BLOTA|nr:hypothetical protein RDWZM_009023 [Blomia tropicalis]
MAATTMAATNCSTGQSDLIVNRSSESSSIEMNARFSHMQLKSSSTSSVSQSNSNSFSNHCMIPKRQPTIIKAIHDISKPDNHEIVKEVDDAENDLDDDDDENGNIDSKSLERLFKLKKGKEDKKPKWHYGPRVFQLCLTDGHRECIAIEYKPISFLHVNMVGYKILLSGPFDVYNGVILLESHMIKIVSEFVLEDTVHNDQME